MEMTLAAVSAAMKLIVIGALGFIGAKVGFLTEKRIEDISAFLRDILLPVMFLAVGFKNYSPALLKGIGYSFVVSLIAQLFGTLCAFVLIRKKNNPDWQVEHATVCASNVGFIGTAIISTMLGGDALIYMVGAVMSSNILIWTTGEWTMHGKVSKEGILRFLKSRANLSMIIGLVIYFLHPSFPAFISEPITTVGGMTGSFAMIVGGGTLARADIKGLLKRKNTYLVLLCKLVLSPLLVIPFVLLTPGIDPLLGITTFITVCCPAATLITVLAIQYKKDAAYASGLMAMTLVFCMITIPALTAVYSLIVG